MSENEKDNIVEFKSKSQKRRIAKELGQDINASEISDEDFAVFMKAFLGPYKGSGYNPE
jgi:hypothetical protein